ncbi:MAG: hypothetical protein AABX82_06240 [Nanoarchaeota archaeon]
MVKEKKTNLYLLSIVGIVAVVGIDETKHLQFSWDHSITPSSITPSSTYYIILEMWNTYNPDPLGPIEENIERLQEDGYEGGIGMDHVYKYKQDM